MRITDVIRGEEHLSNTGRQALLYRALDEGEPRFLHLGVILGPDGKKLSKRHGAASIAVYRRDGYLPEALVNYLALLGWNHPAGKEEFEDLAELAQSGTPRASARAPPLRPGPPARLQRQAHPRLPAEELRRLVEPYLQEPLPQGRELLAVEAIREDMRVLSEAPRLLRDISGPVDPRRSPISCQLRVTRSLRVWPRSRELPAG